MFADQFSSAAKANLDAQLAAASQFHSKAFNGVSRLFELNLQAARTSFDEAAVTAQQLLAARDVRDVVQMLMAQGQPTAAKAIAYTRNLAGIAASTQQELAKAAEEQAADRTRQATALVDELLKNAPAGSEQVVSLIKTAISNTSAGMEQLHKFTKQTNEAVEENFGKIFAQFAETEKPARARK